MHRPSFIYLNLTHVIRGQSRSSMFILVTQQSPVGSFLAPGDSFSGAQSGGGVETSTWRPRFQHVSTAVNCILQGAVRLCARGLSLQRRIQGPHYVSVSCIRRQRQCVARTRTPRPFVWHTSSYCITAALIPCHGCTHTVSWTHSYHVTDARMRASTLWGPDRPDFNGFRKRRSFCDSRFGIRYLLLPCTAAFARLVAFIAQRSLSLSLSDEPTTPWNCAHRVDDRQAGNRPGNADIAILTQSYHLGTRHARGIIIG